MVLFRVDGNAIIGIGHVMRCLSIADTFCKFGDNCCFVTSSKEIKNVISAKGYQVKVLNSDYDNMENEKIEEYINIGDVKIIFVDSYFITFNYLQKLHNFCRENDISLVYMDDTISFPYACDILINYNIYAKESNYENLYKYVKKPKLLLGTNYVPLRSEFQSIQNIEINRKVKNIFVSTGGADSNHLAVNLAMAARLESFTFHFVIGSLNSDEKELQEIASEYSNIILHKNVKKMSDLMAISDMAISAAGSTLYELCAMQVPTMTYVIADNQLPGAEVYMSRGIMEYCGDIRELGNEMLVNNIIKTTVDLAKDYEKRYNMALKMQQVVDRKGAQRIVLKLKDGNKPN